MTVEQADLLIREIHASYPSAKFSRENLARYRDVLVGFGSFEAAQAAVKAITETEEWFPSVAIVVREYKSAARRLAESRPALPGPEVTETERRENLKRLAALTSSIGRSFEAKS